MKTDKSGNKMSPLKITVIYALVGSLWILLSDKLLGLLVSNPIDITRFQTIKGWLFILITSWMLYLLIRKAITAIQESQEALRKSEERYRSLIDDVLYTTKVGIIIVDSNFKVAWINRSLEEFFGFSRKELIGKDKREILNKKIKLIFENSDKFTKKVLATYEIPTLKTLNVI